MAKKYFAKEIAKGNAADVQRLTIKAMSDVTAELNELLHRYDYADTPFVIAGMEIAVESIKRQMSIKELTLTSMLRNSFGCKTVKIGINLQELERQKNENS